MSFSSNVRNLQNEQVNAILAEDTGTLSVQHVEQLTHQSLMESRELDILINEIVLSNI